MVRFRIERDSIGNVKVPSDSYYGSTTQRTINTFPISDLHLPDELIRSYAIIKRSAAIANMKLGSLDPKIGAAIVKAADDVASGKLKDQFKIDVFQAGAGTSTNMNLNEVIANRALETLHKHKGDYSAVHPNDHVNMSQSTNDTYHSAVNIAAYIMIMRRLIPALERYNSAVESKRREFKNVVKLGRTHLMDAVPITLAQEFDGYLIGDSIAAIKEASKRLLQLGIGGTAVGTGMDTAKRYHLIAVSAIARSTGYRFVSTKNTFKFTQDLTDAEEVSGELKDLSLRLIKTANDLRLLSSGPYAGLHELNLPPVMPGSSIMPGKVNPSVPEMLTMVCFQVIGNDLAISMAVQAAQLELNVFSPVIAYDLLNSIQILSNAIQVFTDKCVKGIEPNRGVMASYAEHNAEIGTALSPFIGYAKAAKLIKEAQKSGVNIKELAIKKRLLPKAQLERLLNPKNLTRPNLKPKKG